MMLSLSRTTHIDADAGTVYDILIDLEQYQAWNPWNIAAEGTPEVGGPLVTVTAKLGGSTKTVEHRILEMTPGRVFKWCDVGWFTKLAYGQRTRTITPSDGGGVDYEVSLEITGPLVWLVRILYGRHLEQGIADETAALTERAENTRA